MASFDPNDLVPIGNSQYELNNWTPVKQEELPDYVKQAVARGGFSAAYGLSPEVMKDAEFGSWDLNGQKNYGFKVDPANRIEIMDENNKPSGVYMDKAGNILGSGGFNNNTYGVQVPWSQAALENADRSLYLRPSFYGQTITNTPGSSLAYDFTDGMAAPSRDMVDYAQRAQKAADIAGKVSPLAYMAPLFPLAIGLGAGALGATPYLGAGMGAAEGALSGAGAGAVGAGAGATEGALAAGLPAATVAENTAPLTILSATNTPVAAGETLGAVGGSAGLGSAPTAAGTASGAIGGGAGLGGTAATTTPAASGGFLGGINSAVAGSVESALTSLGIAPETAASIAPVASKAVLGAVTGGAMSGLTGGNPLTGALTGGLTGGVLGAFGGVGGPVASALDIAPKYADMLIGGATGGLGALATKQNPLIGALGGVAAGYANDAMGNISNDPTAATAAGGAGGVKGGINGTSLALGALAAAASAMGNKKTTTPTTTTTTTSGATPGPESVAGTLGPYFNKPLETVANVRTPVNPFSGGVPNYWTYGGPEQTYYTGNSLKSFGFAEGGPIDGGYPTDDGREFSTAYGDAHVRGPGSGTSDSIAARLSDGEFVLRARDVTAAGGGDNDKGAEKLDRLMRSGALSRMIRDA